ncbi:MAG: hypothetical protein N2746_04815 [Deltaproteobacteria bacterium]|nr:hypothetical protein [Deltaproteobacteria bacterium]
MLYKIIAIILILLSPEAKSIKEQIKQDNSPVEIKAKKLKIENQNRKAIFTGDVEAIRTDMKITCNQLVAYYNEKGSIDKFECIGNVNLKKGEKVATSDMAVFEYTKSLVTMTGNPYYSDGENKFWGEVVEFDLDKDEVNVKSIKAIIKVKEDKR